MKINYLGYVKSILKETRTLHSYEAKFLAATVQCYYFELFGRIEGKSKIITMSVSDPGHCFRIFILIVLTEIPVV